MRKLTAEEVGRYQLNSSPSKMQYSFSQSKRFQQSQPTYLCPNASCKNAFYPLPEISHRRSTSFGFGKKSTIEIEEQLSVPGPTAYFKQTAQPQRNTGFTFGVSREVPSEIMQKAKNNSFNRRDPTIPGPNYYAPQPMHTLSKSFSMSKSKLAPLAQPEPFPGPSEYANAGVKESGKYILARYKNLPGVTIPKRCKTEHEDPTPGPFDYKPQFLNARGKKSIDAKNPTNAFSFAAEKRKAASKVMEISKFPGPGAQFSDFIP